MLYDTEYHDSRVFDEAYGIKNTDSIVNTTPIIPRVKTIDYTKHPKLEKE